MTLRRAVALTLSLVLLGATAEPLVGSAADMCGAHQHESNHHDGHDHPADGSSVAPQVAVTASASACPHCPDASCAFVATCAGLDTGRNSIRPVAVGVRDDTAPTPAERGASTGPPTSPPTPPPVST